MTSSIPSIRTITFSSEIQIELIKHSASDSDVIFAARVSTQGERSKNSIAENSNIDGSTTNVTEVSGLINYLMKNRHGSPFEHSYFTFYVKAPIFVWREHMRHRIASYNEESGRYKVLEPEFYIPKRERHLQQIGKPGSYDFTEGTDSQYAITRTSMERTSILAYEEYFKLLSNGVAKEVARMVLPVNIFSSAYVSMNARALMNFLSLRVSSEDSTFRSFPQKEIEIVGQKYEEYFSTIMPITYEAFISSGRVAP